MVMATNPTPAATQPAPTPSVNTAPPPNQVQGQQQGTENNTGAATVSPESVGRLFVQQYYTVLNKAPNLLHRFYTHNSSFVHGKVYRDGNSEEPVYGPDIYYKILTLEFRDCFAKIRQVDSYATLGDGVVVQVTGELSTHGKPMRRFTQTFVLAPHSARNYYVRNDIFRYHDEVFQEVEEEEEDNEGSAEEEAEETRSEPSEPTVPQEPLAPVATSVQEPAVPIYCESPQPSVSSNGTAHLDSPTATPPKPPSLPPQQDDQEEPEEEQEDLIPTQPPMVEEQHPSPAISPPPPPQSLMENHETETTEEEKEELKEPVSQGLKVFSWADRARQSPSGGPVPVASKPPSQPPVSGPAVPKAAEGFGSSAPRGSANEGLPQREPRRDRREGQRWPRRGPGDMAGEGERSRRGGDSSGGRNYPDNQQLFVGNLPQNIKDEELMDYFSQYGKVVEMRINRNANPKLPYFGFIVFDEPGPVRSILELKKSQAILFRDGYRLNVEEKKAKGTDPRPRVRDGRPGSGGPPPRGGPPGRGGGRGGGPGSGPNRGGGGGRMYNPQR